MLQCDSAARSPRLKILLVSDLHYALKQFDWVVSAAPSFDLIALAGDHIDIAGQLSGGVQVTVILKYLRRLAALAPLAVSSGNHDLDTRDSGGEKVASWMQRVRQLGIAADGDTIETNDTIITICPWWDGPLARETVDVLLKRDAAKRAGKSWIWVYHAPPADSPTSWNGRTHFGDADLVTWIEQHQPDLVLTGHIHEAPFKRGGSWADRVGSAWIFNAGRQIGPTPTYIAVDTKAREAAWFSLAGAELVRLDAPLERPLLALETAPAWLNNPDRGLSPA